LAALAGSGSGVPNMPAVDSPDAYRKRFLDRGYVLARESAVALYVAESLGRPLLVEGPAGVGKTEMARTLADVAERPFLRLQCYEGLDESRALYEWEYTKQLLYTQILRDKIGEVIAGAHDLESAIGKL